MQAGKVNRPNIPVMLQATSVEYRDTPQGRFTVERLPYATPARDLPQADRFAGRQYIMAHLPDGYFDYDLNNGNYGRLSTVSGDLWVVLDPDAVRKAK